MIVITEQTGEVSHEVRSGHIVTSLGAVGSTDNLLLEDGTDFLLEDGTQLTLG